MSFDTLGLNPAILRALNEAGYTTPTEVQARTVPAALTGTDLRVCSNTGSGKTAAFVLPALQKILQARADAHAAAVAAAEAAGQPIPSEEPCPADRASERPERFDPRRRKPRFTRDRDAAPRSAPSGPSVLVLAPTRELALQVAKAADVYGRFVPGLRVATAVGGMPYPVQIKALRGSLDILIATPGRLIDHLESGTARLGEVQMLVLDEADRMLDMGFIEDIERIASAVPADRQTVMVSATFAGTVGRLAQQLQKADAQRIDVSSHTDSHDNITQQLLWADDLAHKDALLDHVLTSTDLQQAVVFTSTQRDADSLAERLYHQGHAVAPLHGGMPQGMRNRTLMALRRGELRVLVATDVAARGIDVPTISHVINYGLPMKAEDYVHRIGRTGRAGRSGRAVTLAERDDAPMLRRIQRFTTQQIPIGTITGLEPKRTAPRLDARPEGRPGSFGGRPGYGRPGSRPGPGRNDRYPEYRHDSRPDLREHRFEPHRDSHPGERAGQHQEQRRPDAYRTDQRHDARPAPRGEHRHDMHADHRDQRGGNRHHGHGGMSQDGGRSHHAPRDQRPGGGHYGNRRGPRD